MSITANGRNTKDRWRTSNRKLIKPCHKSLSTPENQLDEQLVSYLDGELDTESCRRIEELLAIDPEVRQKLHWLEQTWEVLDELDATPVGDDFTRTTLEMVAVAAAEDVRKGREEAPRHRRRMWLLTIGAMLAACVTGYASVVLIATNPNKELLQDLPILENLDEFIQVKDMQYLRMLQKVKAFAEDENGSSSISSPASVYDNPDEHVKALSPRQKYDLWKKQQRFNGLDDDVKKNLLLLNKQIQEDEHPEQLRRVMEHYYDWYKSSLQTWERPKLNELTPEKRIEWINTRFQDEQTKITSTPPTSKDADRLWHWMDEYAEKHEKSFTHDLPPWMQNNLKNTSPAKRRQALIVMMWFRPQSGGPSGFGGPGGPSRTVQITEDDLKQLRSKFTTQTQKLLETKSTDEQIQAIQKWANHLSWQKRGSIMGTLSNDEELAKFFEKDLKDEDRDRLLNMSGDDMMKELLRLYILKNRPPSDPQRGQEDYRRGPPPGEGPGPDRHHPADRDKTADKDK